MTNNSETSGMKGNKLIAIVFCFLIFVLFLFVSYINLPRNKAINIYKNGISSFSELNDKWYCLEAENYEVLDEFGEFVTVDSTFLYSVKYYYFNVLVTDSKGEQFIMGVRTDKKTEQLRKGNSVDLYGMVSPLDEEIGREQLEKLEDDHMPTLSLSLNDNDTSVLSRCVHSMVFLGMALLDLLLILFILRK